MQNRKEPKPGHPRVLHLTNHNGAHPAPVRVPCNHFAVANLSLSGEWDILHCEKFKKLTSSGIDIPLLLTLMKIQMDVLMVFASTIYHVFHSNHSSSVVPPITSRFHLQGHGFQSLPRMKRECDEN